MMPHTDSTTAVRVTPDRSRADDWALALASAGIDSRIDRQPDGWVVQVRASDLTRADRIITAFDAENAPRVAPAATDAIPPHAPYAPIIVATLLCALFVITGPRKDGQFWFDRGSAMASVIASGELWRTVTALTLHADFPHILTNAATLVLFGPSLCGLVGSGVAIWILLLSGAVGNWLTAILRGAPYSAVGASTAIFGGIGALAAIELMRRRRGVPVSKWRAWAPIAAGLGLLGFLGTSPQADVLAHLFGFAVGAGLGAASISLQPLRDRLGLQVALSVGALLIVIACWVVAIH